MARTIVREIILRIKGEDLATVKLKGISSALKDMGKIAGGILAAMGIQSLANAIVGLGKTALDAASHFQTMTIALDTLAAREAVLGGTFETIGDAMAQTEGTASILLDRLRDLSLESPFEYEQIVGAFRMNMAFGSTTAMAMDLSGALSNVGAALGMTNEMLGRTSYNLAQAVIAGDLTMMNLRQLKMVGVDLAGILRDRLGLSIEQVRKQLQQGKITLADVSQAFVDYVEINFGGAAKRMTRTFQGLVSNVKDLFFFSAADLLTPALNEVTGALADAFDAARTLLDSGVLKAIGIELGKIAHVAVEAGRNFITKFGGQMQEAAENALRWGVKIVAELATGMVQGAAQALIWAMNVIGNLLTSWLAPGSPPKVAPNLDKWGMAAMESYIAGMASADLGALSDIQGPLKSALSALVAMGELGQEQVGRMFAELSIDLAALIEEFTRTGKVGGPIFDKLAKLGGKFGEHLVEMVRGQLDLLAATKALKSAQDRLNQAREKEDDASEAVKALKQEYFELRRAGASDEVLKAKFAEIKAAQTNLRASRKETEEAEKAEEAARRKLDPLEEQVDIQRQILEQLAQMAQMQARPTAVPGGKAGKGLLADLEMPPFPVGPWMGNLQDALDDAKNAIMEKLKDIFAPLVEAWETKMKPAIDAVIAKWGEFKGILSDFWNSDFVVGIRDWIKDLFPEGTLERMGKWIATGLLLALAFKILAVAAGILFSPLVLLGIAIAVLAGLWEGHSDEIAETTRQLWVIVSYYMLELITWLQEKVAIWEANWENFNLIVGLAWEGVQAKTEEVWGVLEGIWESFNEWFRVILPASLDIIKKEFSTQWEDIKWAVSGPYEFLKGVFKAIKDFAGWLTGHVFNFKINLPKLPDWATPGSPIPLHEAWKDFAADMRALKFDFPATPTMGLTADAFGGGMQPAFAGMGNGPITVIIEGNVLDRRMVRDIGDEIARQQRLRGIRRY